MSSLKVAIIGGSGLVGVVGGAAGEGGNLIATPFGATASPIVEANWDGVDVLLLARHGVHHHFPPSSVPYRANIFALKEMGATHILATGAVGSLRQELKPRDLVVLDDVIDKTTQRNSTFFYSAAVHVEFAQPFCPVLRKLLLEAAERQTGTKVHNRGTYVCMEGPQFSSRAESLMHRLWGGDVVGMTAMPEAKLAREAELPYAMVALVSDYDSWRTPPQPKPGEAAPDPESLLTEIRSNLRAAGDAGVALVRRTVALMATKQDVLATCPAHHALQHAIWTDSGHIPTEVKERLKPLWGKYLQ